MTQQRNVEYDEYKPRFRQEVNVVQVSSGNYIVKDPDSDSLKYFQCNRLQVEIIKRLDGQTSLQAIADQVGKLFKTNIPPQKISNFIVSLDKQMLLEPESINHLPEKLAKKAAKLAQKRWKTKRALDEFSAASRDEPNITSLLGSARRLLAGGKPTAAARHLASVFELDPDNQRAIQAHEIIKQSILKQSPRSDSHWPMIGLFNPYPLLVKLHRWFGFVFTNWFILLLISASLVSLAITITSWDVIWNACFTWKAWTGARFAVALGIILLMLFVHELGHGVACVHYGGKPRKIGVMLLFYIAPAAYCDVTDTVLFDSRRARIFTFVAGVVATTIIWCIVTPLWLFTQPGTFLNDTLLITSAASGIINIGQFLPLYKFDGHFIMAGMAGHQALYEDSLQYFRSKMLRPLLDKLHRRLWGPLCLLGLINIIFVSFITAYLFNTGKMIGFAALLLLCYGIITLFIQASKGPLNDKEYNHLKRDFAIYALIFLCVWLVAAAKVLWVGLVPYLKGYGVVIVLYLVLRGLRRNWRLVFCARKLEQPVFAGSLRPWVLAATIWLAVDLSMAGLIHWSQPVDGKAWITVPESQPVHVPIAGKLAVLAARKGQRIAPGQLLARLKIPDLQLVQLERNQQASFCNNILRNPESGLLIQKNVAWQTMQQKLHKTSHTSLWPNMQYINLHQFLGLVAPQIYCWINRTILETAKELKMGLPLYANTGGIVTSIQPKARMGTWFNVGEHLLSISQSEILQGEIQLKQLQPTFALQVGQPAQLVLGTGKTRILTGKVSEILMPLDSKQALNLSIALQYRPGWLHVGMEGQGRVFGVQQSLLQIAARIIAELFSVEFWKVL